jgi:hypothetical protein
MLPFMGVVDGSTIVPFFINGFLSLGFGGGLLSSSKGHLGSFNNELSLIVFTFFPLVISWPVLSRRHPHSYLFGYSNNNTFTPFPCHNMVILIND